MHKFSLYIQWIVQCLCVSSVSDDTSVSTPAVWQNPSAAGLDDGEKTDEGWLQLKRACI